MVAFNITKWKILSSKLSKLDDELEPPVAGQQETKILSIPNIIFQFIVDLKLETEFSRDNTDAMFFQKLFLT